MRIGIDIVRIKRIKKLLLDPAAVKKIFHESESSPDPEKMAGFFAAKEAYFKAVGEKGDWLDLRLENDTSGKPKISAPENANINLSISHDGGYAVAVVILD